MRVGMWRLTPEGPRRLEADSVRIEQDLEKWIERDPSLVSSGLKIVGRQLKVEGGRIDLLGIDVTGDFVVIEIKRGALYRETLAQGLDYLECIATMDGVDLEHLCAAYLASTDGDLRLLLAEREATDQLDVAPRRVWLALVGTDVQPRLARIADFLEASIRVLLVTFNVFSLPGEQQVLVRELTERDDVRGPRPPPHDGATLERLTQVAASNGVGEGFGSMTAAGLRLGLHPRAYRTSIMFTPPSQRNRMLFTVWTTPRAGQLKVYVSPRAVAEFYPIDEAAAERELGPEGFHYLDTDRARALAHAYERLLAGVLPASAPSTP